MFQSSIFDEKTLTGESPFEEDREKYCLGTCLVKDDVFLTTSTYRKQRVQRATKLGDLIDTHTKLPKKNQYGEYQISCKQVKGDLKNLVSGVADIVILENPSFKISEASRQRVIREQSKNVHAYVRGTFVDAWEGVFKPFPSFKVITYNPYLAGYFFYRDSEGEDVLREVFQEDLLRYAIVAGSSVYLTDIL
jgi:hypothetical protein